MNTHCTAHTHTHIFFDLNCFSFRFKIQIFFFFNKQTYNMRKTVEIERLGMNLMRCYKLDAISDEHRILCCNKLFRCHCYENIFSQNNFTKKHWTAKCFKNVNVKNTLNSNRKFWVRKFNCKNLRRKTLYWNIYVSDTAFHPIHNHIL